jgi:hypothetical protein
VPAAPKGATPLDRSDKGRRCYARGSPIARAPARMTIHWVTGCCLGYFGITRGEQPTGGRGSDSEPRCHVDPIGGRTPERMQFQNHVPPTFDPREEPGALAAHAGICAGGEE